MARDACGWAASLLAAMDGAGSRAYLRFARNVPCLAAHHVHGRVFPKRLQCGVCGDGWQLHGACVVFYLRIHARIMASPLAVTHVVPNADPQSDARSRAGQRHFGQQRAAKTKQACCARPGQSGPWQAFGVLMSISGVPPPGAVYSGRACSLLALIVPLSICVAAPLLICYWCAYHGLKQGLMDVFGCTTYDLQHCTAGAMLQGWFLTRFLSCVCARACCHSAIAQPSVCWSSSRQVWRWGAT